jgi:hypothetical protein
MRADAVLDRTRDARTRTARVDGLTEHPGTVESLGASSPAPNPGAPPTPPWADLVDAITQLYAATWQRSPTPNNFSIPRITLRRRGLRLDNCDGQLLRYASLPLT